MRVLGRQRNGGIGRERATGRLSGPVLRGRPPVRVGVQGRLRLGVAERALDGGDVAAGGDETRGVEVPEVMQSQASDAGALAGLAPLVADGVLVRRRPGRGFEQQAALLLDGGKAGL